MKKQLKEHCIRNIYMKKQLKEHCIRNIYIEKKLKEHWREYIMKNNLKKIAFEIYI